MIIFPITLKNFVRTLQNFVIVKKIVRVDDLQVFVTVTPVGMAPLNA